MKRRLALVLIAGIVAAGSAFAEEQKIGRPVRVVSIGFSPRPLEQVAPLVAREAARGTDLIVLPETFTGQTAPEALDGASVTAMAAIAKQHHTYIVCPIDRTDGGKRLNTAVLLDREGKITGLYNKVFPFWSEYDLKPGVDVGDEAPVFETDFGRLGMAICFDANYPEVWQRMADRGAELVAFSSAYSAGMSLQAHAINGRFYIVSSTMRADCFAWDISGELLLYEKSNDVNISRLTLDLDRCIFHQDFNMNKHDKLLKEHADDVMQDRWLDREAWFVLKAKRPGVSARALAHEYGMEELRDYITRSRYEIDVKRGWPFAEKVRREQEAASKAKHAAGK